MIKKQELQIAYRPSEEVKSFMAHLLGTNPILSKSHLLEMAMRFLKSQSPEKLKDIFYGILSGLEEDQNFEKKSTMLRKTG